MTLYLGSGTLILFSSFNASIELYNILAKILIGHPDIYNIITD